MNTPNIDNLVKDLFEVSEKTFKITIGNYEDYIVAENLEQVMSYLKGINVDGKNGVDLKLFSVVEFKTISIGEYVDRIESKLRTAYKKRFGDK